MLTILNAMQSIFPILILIFVGYMLTLKKWFDEKTSDLFSKIVVNVSLPALMFYNVINNLNKKQLLHMGFGLIAAFSIIFTSYAISYLLFIIIKIDRKKFGLFSAIFAFSNTIFVGLPVNEALFGDKSIPFVLLYYVANTSLFWTLGVYAVRKDVDNLRENLFSIKNSIKKIISPPLIGFLIGIFFIIINLKTPQFLIDTAKYMGQMTTPLSMLFIGIIICLTDFKEFKIDKNIVLLFLGRCIISPLIAIVTLHFFNLNPLMKKVFVIQSALPVITQIAIVSRAYSNDQKYPAMMIAITNILSLFIIPAYFFIVNLLW